MVHDWSSLRYVLGAALPNPSKTLPSRAPAIGSRSYVQSLHRWRLPWVGPLEARCCEFGGKLTCIGLLGSCHYMSAHICNPNLGLETPGECQQKHHPGLFSTQLYLRISLNSHKNSAFIRFALIWKGGMPKDTGNKCFACRAAQQHQYVKCLLGNRWNQASFIRKWCLLLSSYSGQGTRLQSSPGAASIENAVGLSWLTKIIRLLEPHGTSKAPNWYTVLHSSARDCLESRWFE